MLENKKIGGACKIVQVDETAISRNGDMITPSTYNDSRVNTVLVTWRYRTE